MLSSTRRRRRSSHFFMDLLPGAAGSVRSLLWAALVPLPRARPRRRAVAGVGTVLVALTLVASGVRAAGVAVGSEPAETGAAAGPAAPGQGGVEASPSASGSFTNSVPNAR